MTEMTVDVSKVAIPTWVHVYWKENYEFLKNVVWPE